MTINYDPELPIWVSYSSGDRAVARFRNLEEANRYRDMVMSEGVVIDTTPKPKIPEDAEFLQWDNSDQSFYAMRYGKTDEWWVTYSGSKEDSFYYLSDLLILIGDAEVTVLVRKEDS